MMILLRYWRYIAAVLVVLAAIVFVYMKGDKAGYARGKAELEAFRVEVGTRILEANARADQAAQDFETWKRTQRPKVITVIKEVDRVLEVNREWSDAPLPDGVRDALNAATAAINGPGESSGTVPPVSGLDLADECGPGASLPRRLGMGCGMSGEASTTE